MRHVDCQKCCVLHLNGRRGLPIVTFPLAKPMGFKHINGFPIGKATIGKPMRTFYIENDDSLNDLISNTRFDPLEGSWGGICT